MTTVTLLFVLVALLILGAAAIALWAIIRRGDIPFSTMLLGALLVVLAVAVWTIGIRNPLPLP